VRADVPDARFVPEESKDRLEVLERERQSLPPAQRRERAVAWLQKRVQQHRKPCDLNPRFYLRDRHEELTVKGALWWAQEGIFNHGYLFRHFAHEDRELPVTLAIWEGGTNRLQPHLPWLRATCAEGRAVLALDVSGVGAVAPRSLTQGHPESFYGVIHKLADDLIWLDDDLPALRIYDTQRALEMIAQWPGLDATDIRVYAHGRHGLYGQLAAALDSRIRAVEVVEGMGSYAAWVGARHYDTQDIYSVILRDALRYFDLPELT